MNYLGKFIPNHSNITAPLHQLLHKDRAWCWSEQQQKALDTLKQCAIPPLSYYDVHKPVTHASQYGLGSANLLDGSPVSHASRNLIETEQRYTRIEE